MKHIIILSLFVFVISCSVKSTKHDSTTTAPPPAAAQKTNGTKKQTGKETPQQELRRVAAEAEPIIENILTAINKNDYKKYIRDFNDSMRSAYADKGQFKKINK